MQGILWNLFAAMLVVGLLGVALLTPVVAMSKGQFPAANSALGFCSFLAGAGLVGLIALSLNN